jgi:SAM-dependent methyltransferase
VVPQDTLGRFGEALCQRWDYLADVSEAHRYSLIIGCADCYKGPDRTVLDVGCGEGILQRRMAYGRYLGVDLNAEAIRRARPRADATTEFHVAPGESFEPMGLFDVIVFNESLYYIAQPVPVFAHYRRFLKTDGIMIVCNFQTNLARRIWRGIAASGMVELTMIELCNEHGFASVVRVYANAPLQPLEGY